MDTEQLEATKLTRATSEFRSRVLLSLGWLFFGFSVIMLSIHVVWMWNRVGRGAPLIAVGLVMDALVGLALIIMGSRARRFHRNKIKTKEAP